MIGGAISPRIWELCAEHLREAQYPRTLPDAAISLRRLQKQIAKLQIEVAILIKKQAK